MFDRSVRHDWQLLRQIKYGVKMAIKKLDVVTQVCPFPFIEAKAALAEMASGDELVIEFDCTQATEAIPQWAAEEGHAITDYQQIGDAAWSITVQKA